MTLPLFVREIARDLAARKALSGYLADLGEPPAGTLERLSALRDRYRNALIRKAEREALAACDRWEDEAGDADDCHACGYEAWLHPSRCAPDPECMTRDDDDRPLAAYDPSPENPDRCDCCGRTRAEHEPGARPIK